MPTEKPDLTRVSVVGTSCAGKTTFAGELARRLGVPHTELDALHWGPDWTPAPPEAFRPAVAERVAEPRWVVDGNYAVVRDLVWGRATAVVWLDLPFHVVYPRAIRRTFRRIVTREPLWAGNVETLAVTDPEWIPWWVLRTFWRRRRRYPRLLASAPFAHLDGVRLRDGRAVERFLREASPR